MSRTNLQKGLCPKESCGGFLQDDKYANIVYCPLCHWRMDLDDFKEELESASNEYKWRDESDNLSDLNNLGR